MWKCAKEANNSITLAQKKLRTLPVQTCWPQRCVRRRAGMQKRAGERVKKEK